MVVLTANYKQKTLKYLANSKVDILEDDAVHICYSSNQVLAIFKILLFAMLVVSV